MNSPCFSPLRQDRRAVALVIVLAFIVLLTGLTVAFFSSSVLYRQISNSSANEAKVDLFAQGAMDAIVGDLKQEIAAGSNATLYTDANGNVAGQVYRPFNASTAVPALALKGSTAEQTGIAAPTSSIPDPYAPNLVKRSAYQQNFFPAGSDTNYQYYNTGNTSETIPAASTPSASPSPAPARPPSNRAANVSTTVASQNGRSISLARWNKALLLPKANPNPTNDTDFTPINPANPSTASTPPPAGTSEFVAPDWVLVARDGSNPTGAFNGGMATSSTAASTIIGRYGYAIYDEGGLLDANVAGCPVGKNQFGVANPQYANQVAYKNALAYADLTQLPGISSLAGIGANSRQMQVIQSLVGWRNYATAQPSSGTLAGANYNFGSTYTLGPPASPLANFCTAMLTNANGFLRTSNTAIYNGQTDRMFASRQELLRLFLNGIATQGTTGQSDRANIQNALQYLGTFSRELNQPCFTPDSTRPRVVNATPSDPARNGGNDGGGGDDIINPSFPSVRVSTAFTRNDGTTAAIGDPLVSKRFPLNRLAWLTYKGPSALRTIPTSNPGTSSPDYDMWQLVNTYGISVAYLQQGTAANVLAYFGLTWAKDTMPMYGDNAYKWRYDHGISSSGNLTIGTLANVAAAKRDPDFFEIVKAAVCAGSIGKGGNDGQEGYGLAWSYHRDTSVNNSVIQIVANIIDQFDCDGYPTRILFDPKSPPGASTFHQEFYGVENVPYLYRMREGMLQVHEPMPGPKEDGTSSDGNGWQVKQYNTSADLSDPGVGVDLIFPEVWNPHDANSSVGTPAPTSFRFVVDGIDPEFVDPTDAGNGYVRNVWSPSFGNLDAPSSVTPPPTFTGNQYASNYADPSSPVSPGATFSQLYTPVPHTVFASSTALTFQVPSGRNDLFREPTFLSRANMPYGSGLQAGSSNRLLTDPVLKNFALGGGTQSGYDDPFNITPSGTSPLWEPKGTVGYVGVAVGAYPLRWVVQESLPLPSGVSTARKFVVTSNGGGSLRDKTPDGQYTYRMQCADPNGSGSSPWMTYDIKYTDIIANLGHSVEASGTAMQVSNSVFTFDPRTSRFGQSSWAASYADALPATKNLSDWLESRQGINLSNRPDVHSGYDLYIYYQNQGYTSSIGWFPGAVGDGKPFSGTEPLRFGLFAQNNLNSTDDQILHSGISKPSQEQGNSPQYIADPDGIVRRGTAAYVPYTAGTAPATTTIGLPETTATTYSSPPTPPTADTTVGKATTQSQSRPIVLNRPFRSVAELGYVFSGTPWRNLDFFTPSSGDTALLDALCISEVSDPTQQVVAGKVDLNTRQVPVMQAILSGAYTDETNGFSPAPSNTPMVALTSGSVGTTTTSGQAAAIAQALVTRTGTTPLRNVGEVVGSWAGTGTPTPAAPVDGMIAYRGFSGTDPVNAADTSPNLTNVFTNKPFTTDPSATNTPNASNVQRFREAAIRPLAALGATRTWNLMIDIVAQTGRYPQAAASAANPLAAFIVEGEQRYWIHLAIDRYSGQVVDKQVEVVKE